MSLLWWREAGGDGACCIAGGTLPAGVPGSGGSGIAGGGDGSEAAETLLRRLFEPEFERSSSMAGLLEFLLDCLRMSASCACAYVSVVLQLIISVPYLKCANLVLCLL